MLVPNLYHTGLTTLKRDVCGKNHLSSVDFCSLNEVPEEMPILSFALKKLQRQHVTGIKETAAPSEKEGGVFC